MSRKKGWKKRSRKRRASGPRSTLTGADMAGVVTSILAGGAIGKLLGSFMPKPKANPTSIRGRLERILALAASDEPKRLDKIAALAQEALDSKEMRHLDDAGDTINMPLPL